MHLELLVEGQSERTALEPLLTMLLGAYGKPHTWRIHKHRGIGRLPNDIKARPNPQNNTLLHNLPAKLRAYGKSCGPGDAVVVLVDLDDRPDCQSFKKDLLRVLDFCDPAPMTLIRIAIEELESWYLGDRDALRAAYPNAKITALAAYIQDSQCGTWEKLADALYPGGSRKLEKRGYRERLEQKRIWARDIVPHMVIERNQSTSFQVFCVGIQRLVKAQASADTPVSNV